MSGDPVGGRLLSAQVSNEVVPASAERVCVIPPDGVIAVRDDQEIEVLVGCDQRIDETERQVGRDVVVELAVDEQQFALEAIDVRGVGVLDVVGSSGNPMYFSPHELLYSKSS